MPSTRQNPAERARVHGVIGIPSDALQQAIREVRHTDCYARRKYTCLVRYGGQGGVTIELMSVLTDEDIKVGVRVCVDQCEQLLDARGRFGSDLRQRVQPGTYTAVMHLSIGVALRPVPMCIV